jgi:hypothetical protein
MSCGAVPLAFALAMSAEAPGAPMLDSVDGFQALQPGMLKSLVEHATDARQRAMDQSGDRLLPGDKVAQFFPNFRNCFAGMWRNC